MINIDMPHERHDWQKWDIKTRPQDKGLHASTCGYNSTKIKIDMPHERQMPNATDDHLHFNSKHMETSDIEKCYIN